jgi:hypothetical protein
VKLVGNRVNLCIMWAQVHLHTPIPENSTGDHRGAGAGASPGVLDEGCACWGSLYSLGGSVDYLRCVVSLVTEEC